MWTWYRVIMEVQYDWSTLGCVSPFQFALSPIGLLFQNEFMYTEITSLYTSEHLAIGVHLALAV